MKSKTSGSKTPDTMTTPATPEESRRWPVIEYITEEVTRQQHDVTQLDGIQRVGWMLAAWSYALSNAHRKPTIDDAILLGQLIEPDKNRNGLRRVNVRVGTRPCPHFIRVQEMLQELFDARDTLTPLEFYKRFEEVHPFVDGNGRSGKCLLAWLRGNLQAPEFPPADLFGEPIRNP